MKFKAIFLIGILIGSFLAISFNDVNAFPSDSDHRIEFNNIGWSLKDNVVEMYDFRGVQIYSEWKESDWGENKLFTIPAKVGIPTRVVIKAKQHAQDEWAVMNVSLSSDYIFLHSYINWYFIVHEDFALDGFGLQVYPCHTFSFTL